MNERILNILNMCIKAKETGTDCFFSYSPHVQLISIRIFLCGWRDDGEFNYYLESHIDENSGMYSESELQRIEEILRNIINDSEVVPSEA